VRVAPMTASACGSPACSSRRSPGRSIAAVNTEPSAARAITIRTSIRPQPVIHGASPSMRHPFALRSARTAGGPGRRRYANPIPASVEPSQSRGSHVGRAGPSPARTRLTAPWCCCPHERGRTAPTGDRLEHGPAGSVIGPEPARHVGRAVQTEQARVSERPEVLGGHRGCPVGLLSSWEQHVVGHGARPLQGLRERWGRDRSH